MIYQLKAFVPLKMYTGERIEELLHSNDNKLKHFPCGHPGIEMSTNLLTRDHMWRGGHIVFSLLFLINNGIVT